MTGRELSEKLNYLGMERGIRKLALEDNMATAEELAVMSEVEVCELISKERFFPAKENREKWRYLTADEAEKLQTLPAGYTDCVSESARIKAIGNGWTVDVIAHIFRGLMTV